MLHDQFARILLHTCCNPYSVKHGELTRHYRMLSGLCSKSSTGVDWFVLDTEPGCAIRIHKAVDYWAKHIVEQVKNTAAGGSTPTDVSHIMIPEPHYYPLHTPWSHLIILCICP